MRRAPSTRAVAEGFEPSVTCATLAFEASSFGRSDTLPGESLAESGPRSEIHIAGPLSRDAQRSRKKAVSIDEHSSASTPWITSGR